MGHRADSAWIESSVERHVKLTGDSFISTLSPCYHLLLLPLLSSPSLTSSPDILCIKKSYVGSECMYRNDWLCTKMRF